MMTTTTNLQPLLYSPAEAASLLKIGRNRVYELIASGELRSVRPGSRRVLVSEGAIREYIADQEANSAA